MTSIASRFCSICLDTKLANIFNVLPCLHWFCRECLSQMLQKVCPLCRSPFDDEIEISSSEPMDINILSRSAPTSSPGFRRRCPPSGSSILSRSAGSSVDEFESIINLTGLQNSDSLSRVLTELEQRDRSQHRRRRRRRRRRRWRRTAFSPLPPSSPPSTIFQFENDSEGSSDNESKTEEPETLPRRKSQNYGRGDRWAHLNRQRSNRGRR